MKKMLLLPVLLSALIGCGAPAEMNGRASARQAVLTMDPVGYWPANEGEGTVLHDRSGNDRHGTVHHVLWVGGMLNFSPNVYQWAELPGQLASAEAFTIGGWVFTRQGYGCGTLLIGQAFREDDKWAGHDGTGMQLTIGDGEDRVPITVATGGQADAVGIATDNTIAIGQWQHVLYTYHAGTGRLYLNGQLASEATGLSFTPSDQPLVMGSDLGVWAVWPPAKRSLDGSLRDLVVFDRVLTAQEVADLAAATQPLGPPKVATPTPSAPTTTLTEHIRIIQDETAREEDRAASALAVAQMGSTAASAAEPLAEVLKHLVQAEDARLPRVEDMLRNALTRALLDTDPTNERAQEALAVALARPALDTLDLSAPELTEIKALADAGRYMDALAAYRAIPQGPIRPSFFSYGDAQRDTQTGNVHDLSYDALAQGDGATYRMGEGKGYHGVEPVDVEEFARIIEMLSADYPDAAQWRAPDSPNIYRATITRIDADGNQQSAYIGGETFVFDGSDAKVKGWSVAVDSDGYIHIVGGQHNSPNPEHYIPGSWESIGLSRDKSNDAYPTLMYWVSTSPGDINSFEFVGQRGSSRRVPCGWMNYMQFTQHPDGTLLLYGRDHIWSWGLYRYDTTSRRWRGIGGSPTKMVSSAQTSNPTWYTQQAKHPARFGPSPHPALVYAWQPGSYQFNRTGWGVRFDRTGRMHVLIQIHGVGEGSRMVDGPVYAWSDDLGKTFHRADGTPLLLPLTVNPMPGHHADLNAHNSKQWWDLWLSILSEAGLN